ncbi:MAG: LptF/LptG family permease [Bacteroidia bacterium]
MKKIDKLIGIQFFRSFLPTFFVVLFILIMQFIWLYIDELAGKGLGIWVISKLIFYFSSSIIPLALPLSILLASIMSFGNLGESYELIAAKSAGFSIWRIFRPMFLVMAALSAFAFFVSNVIIPKAKLKHIALLYDIRQQKPALMIKEGVFYNGIEGISMRIGGKNPETNELHDILIYDNRFSNLHPVVMTAKRGTMRMSSDDRYLFFNLYNGTRYEELDKVEGYDRTMPHTTYSFAEEQIMFDLFSFKLNRTDENLFKDGYQMLNIFQLRDKMDSIVNMNNQRLKSVYSYYDFYLKLNDPLYLQHKPTMAVEVPLIDSFPGDRALVVDNALNNARVIKSALDFVVNDTEANQKMLIRHEIEWHRKFTLSIACIIMFFIGAPFGTIIRKGGFGMPVVISVILYLVFHIVSIVGEKMAKTGSSSPAVGMWLSIAVLLPIGVFLTYQAANDSGLFDTSAWRNLFQKWFKRKIPA